MAVRKKKEADKPQVIQVAEGDGAVKTIGKYYPATKEFRADKIKKEHFMIKHNAWGLDAKVVDFLLQRNATIIVKEKETKWEFKTSAGEFKLHGILEEHKQHRPQLFLSLDHWEIIRAKEKSFVLKCEETACINNFGLNCLRGVISITKDGECGNFEDKY